MKGINNVTQSNFGFYPRLNFAGMPADSSMTSTTSSIIESGDIFFGNAAVGGSEDHLCIPFDGVSMFFKGISTRRFARTAATIGNDKNPSRTEGDTVKLAIFGRWWVTVSNSVTAGDDGALTAGNEWAGGNEVGNFSVQGATFLTSAEAGETAELELTGGRKITEIVAPAAFES